MLNETLNKINSLKQMLFDIQSKLPINCNAEFIIDRIDIDVFTQLKEHISNITYNKPLNLDQKILTAEINTGFGTIILISEEIKTIVTYERVC